MRPLVFIHAGKGKYVEFVLRQARTSNPNRTIILLGDAKAKKRYKNLAEFYDIESISDDIENFKNCYQHLSPHTRAYEEFCFLRWFYLRNFLKATNQSSVYTFDSDVMIYDDLLSLDHIINQGDGKSPYDFAAYFAGGPRHPYAIAPGITYFSYPSLDSFCQFLLRSYTGDVYEEYKDLYKRKLAEGIREGISDMTALAFFFRRELGNQKTLDLQNLIDERIYDGNINCSDQGGFVFVKDSDNRKVIEFKNGIPYGTDSNGIKRRFCTLHFQGKAKFSIRKYYTGPWFLRQLRIFKR